MDYWGGSGGGGGGGGGAKGMLAPLSNYWGGAAPPPPAPPLFLRLWCVNFSTDGILFVFSFNALIEWLFFDFTAHSDSISVYIGSFLRERESEK